MRKLNGALMGIVLLLAGAAMATAADSDAASHTVTMNVPVIQIIGVTGAPTLALVDPEFGGDVPDGATNSDTVLKYTSVVNLGGSGNKITVEWLAGDEAPSGTYLKVEAAGLVGGATGTNAGQKTMVDLDVTALDLITSIWSCANAGGTAITYTYGVNTGEAELLDVADTATAVTITFTMIAG